MLSRLCMLEQEGGVELKWMKRMKRMKKSKKLKLPSEFSNHWPIPTFSQPLSLKRTRSMPHVSVQLYHKSSSEEEKQVASTLLSALTYGIIYIYGSMSSHSDAGVM